MLKNAYLLAKIGAGTVKNERHFPENLPKIGNYPTGSCIAVKRPCSVRRTLMVTASLSGEPRSQRGEVQATLQGTRDCQSLRGRRRCLSAKFCKFLAGSFSAVSKRKFARKHAFDSIFQALQDLHPFCTAAISKFSQKIGLKKQQFS